MTVTPIHRPGPQARPVFTVTTLAAAGARHARTARRVWRHPAARVARRVAAVPLWAFIGAARALAWVYAWVMHGGSQEFLAAARENPAEGTDAWLKLRADARLGRASRWRVTWITAAVTLVTLAVMWWLARGLAVTLLVTGALALAWFGWTWRHTPAELVPEGVLPSRLDGGQDARDVTYDVIVDALAELPVPGLDRAIKARGVDAIRWDGPIARDALDRGTVARFELPGAVTVTAIAKCHDQLAGALGRSRGMVDIAGDPKRSTSWMELYLPDRDIAYSDLDPWPLLHPAQTADYFAPFVVAVDPRGRDVTLSLAERNLLAGGEPGSGKTSGVCAVLFGVAQDPTVRVRVYELKGTGDLEHSALFAEDYFHGQSPEAVERAFEGVRSLLAESRERALKFNDVPREMRPDYKVTRAISDRWPDEFGPIVLVLDEAQRLLMDDKLKDEAGAMLVELTRLARSSAITAVVATQRPEKNTLPTNLRANMHVRLGFKVDDEHTNKMILGGNAADRGLCAHKLEEGQPGIAYVIGAASHATPTKARFHYLRQEDRQVAGQQARDAREHLGLLRGLAAGVEFKKPDLPEHDFLGDVLAVTSGHPRAKIWTANLIAALAEAWPHKYGDATEESVAKAFARYGITSEDAWDQPREGGTATTRRGYALAPIRARVHERRRGAGIEEAA